MAIGNGSLICYVDRKEADQGTHFYRTLQVIATGSSCLPLKKRDFVMWVCFNEQASYSKTRASLLLPINWSSFNLLLSLISGRSRGPIRPLPPSKLAMEFGPPRGRKYNDSIVNLAKCKDFGPLLMLATDLAPLRKNATLKAI